MPPRDTRLETADATYFHFKSDIFSRLVTYSTDSNTIAANLVTISADRAFEIISLNKAGEKPLTLAPESQSAKAKPRADFGDILGGERTISALRQKEEKTPQQRKEKFRQQGAEPRAGTRPEKRRRPDGQGKKPPEGS